jgi:hypothetical protein
MLANGFSLTAEFFAAGSVMSQNGRLWMPLKSSPLKTPGTPIKKEAGQAGPGDVWFPQYIPV